MSHPLPRGSRHGFLCAIVATSLTLPLVDARTWTDSIGRPFEAELVRVDGENVILTLPNGRGFSMKQS